MQIYSLKKQLETIPLNHTQKMLGRLIKCLVAFSFQQDSVSSFIITFCIFCPSISVGAKCCQQM